jgi:hypothetical protein
VEIHLPTPIAEPRPLCNPGDNLPSLSVPAHSDEKPPPPVPKVDARAAQPVQVRVVWVSLAVRVDEVAEEVIVPESAGHDVSDLGNLRVPRVAQDDVRHSVDWPGGLPGWGSIRAVQRVRERIVPCLSQLKQRP